MVVSKGKGGASNAGQNAKKISEEGEIRMSNLPAPTAEPIQQKFVAQPKKKPTHPAGDGSQRLQLMSRAKQLRILNRVYTTAQKWRKTTAQHKVYAGAAPATKSLNPRYKPPIEKLLKSIKKARIEEIPPDVNIHRHPIKKPTWAGSRGVRKQVDLLREIFLKEKRPVQPKVGFAYNKRQRRLLLGRRHRELDKGWRYCEPLKGCLPRKLRPNSHVPDAIFFIFSTILLLSFGIHRGTMNGMYSIMYVLEDSVEYKLTVEGLEIGTDVLVGQDFWAKKAPYEYFVTCYQVLRNVILIIILLGFIGVYIMDQTLHFIYIVGLSLCFAGLFVTAQEGQKADFCKTLLTEAMPILELLVERYYETVAVYAFHTVDQVDKPVMWDNPDTNVREQVKIRTYKAANLMDRIQKSWHCCGVSGFSDYVDKGFTIPSTCCSQLWHLNPYCGAAGYVQGSSKLLPETDGQVGCKFTLQRFCKNAQGLIGTTMTRLLIVQVVLFAITCYGLVLQARQIRQLKRRPHLRISAGTISQSLQTSSGTDATVKTGGGGVQAVADASKLTQKQIEHAQQLKFEAAKFRANEPLEEEPISGSTGSSEEAPVTTVDFVEMQNLQMYVDREDLPETEKLDLDKTVAGFAGRYNIVASKNLQPYVPAIFSTTYQNETNAGLEAINTILERQFAQHTTDYNWRKLLTKPKKEDISVAPSQQNIPKISPIKQKVQTKNAEKK